MAPVAGRQLAQALAVVASVLLVATTVAAYAWRALFDSDQFADRATAVLQDPNVRQAIGERVTDQLVLERQPDLVAGRPIIADTVSRVVGGEAFASLFRHSVRDVHRAVFESDQDTVTLTLADAGIVVAAALRELQPDLAARLDRRERVVVLSRDIGSATGDLARLADKLRWLTYILAALTLITMAVALAAGPDRRRTATRLGVAAVVAGVVIVAADMIARPLVLERVSEPDLNATAEAVWDAFLGDLRTAGWLIAASGAIVGAAAASLIRPIEVEEPLRVAWRLVITEPESTIMRAARGAGLVAAGVLVITQPAAVLRIVATLVGVYVVYKGLETLLRLISGPDDRPATDRARPRRGERRRARRVASAVVATLLIGTALAAFIGGGGIDEPIAAVSRCNGHAELCDRPLDEVTLPVTHNSMSVPLPGWFSSLQERPISGQLEDGVRGLLFDTHYADRLANGRTRTYFGDGEEVDRAIEQDGVSEESVQAAERLRGRLGFRGSGERGMYLCHTFCELGATPLASVLEDIHEFLVTHPAEVLVVINQDYVTPADFVGAIGDAGLAGLVFEPPTRAPWPTLRQLIDRDQRLVLLAENRAGAAPWYELAYERITQETPFAFATTAELTTPAELASSCRGNRGPRDAPLFLLNHWINTDPVPRPSNADVVNARDALLARARTCQRTRGHRLNLLAVDFYKRGDLFEVVDTLNGF